jgi:serine/threonine protein kinase
VAWGTVYAARHPVIGNRVAIKVLASHLCNDPTLVRRFVDEARAVNKIGHQNIVDIFAFGQLGDPDHPGTTSSWNTWTAKRWRRGSRDRRPSRMARSAVCWCRYPRFAALAFEAG